MAGAPATFLFRVDAGASLGGGHVMRCLTLADELKRRGGHCVFFTRYEALEIVPRLSRCGHEVNAVKGDEEDLRRSMAQRKLHADWLVIDHYGLQAADETALRRFARRILVIDDLADRPHDCDLLVDATIGRTADSYRGLVPPSARVLAGADYALLRPEFAAMRDAALTRRAQGLPARPRVLVSLGMTDVGAITARVVEALCAQRLDVALDVVVARAAPSMARLGALAAQHSNIRLHHDVANMAELMAACDLAIGAGGQTSLERCALGLPSLILVLADNQRFYAAALAERGAARIVTAEHIAAALADLLTAPAQSKSMAEAALHLCDAKGAARIAELISASPIMFRAALPADSALILRWRNDPVTRKFSRNSAEVSPAEHDAWYAARTSHAGTMHLIATQHGEPCGVVRFDRLADGAAEVNINVAPEHRGRRLGHFILQGAIRHAVQQGFCHTLIAEVREDNGASIWLFERLGFSRGACKEGWIRFHLDANGASL